MVNAHLVQATNDLSSEKVSLWMYRMMKMRTKKDLTSQIMELSDGRRLGYAEYGNFNGKPVFYIHGSLGSRLEAAFVEEEKVMDLGIRLICIDRPGMGLSDYQSGRKILDLPEDTPL